MVKDSDRYAVKDLRPRHELVDIYYMQVSRSFKRPPLTEVCTGTGGVNIGIVLIQYSKERGIKPVVLQN